MSLFNLNLPTPLVSAGDAPNASSFPALVANHAANILIAIAIPLAIAGVLYSAYVLMMGRGDPAAYTTVKKNLFYILTGAAIMVFTALIFNFVVGIFR